MSKIILFLGLLYVGLCTINVHLIPHTHDDVGWLYTPEQYYDNEVVNILNTLVPALSKDQNRTFVYVEMYFFEKWWVNQTEETKEKVKTFVKNGQLEFIGGGWSMEDEACTSIHDMLNNMALGHQFLLKEFGVKPRIGWQIDPFGHSAAQAVLFAKMGFNGLFFGRYDYQEYEQRKANRTLEMFWKPHRSHEGLYTQGFYDQNYCQKCFYLTPSDHDDWCNSYFNEMASYYRTNHILVPMGCDFSYQYAEQKFSMMDQMISYYKINPQLGLNVFYSTPSKYLQAVNDAGLELPVKTDEFFPYSNNNNSFWTGFFTSRPSQKLNVRQYSKILHASQFLQVSRYQQSEMNNLNQFQRQMGINQHHDGITGTEKQAVADNYVKELVQAGENSTFKNIVGYLYNVTTFQCPLLNQSRCDHNGGIIIYNPSFHTKEQTVRIPVEHTGYNIKNKKQLGLEGKRIKCTILANLFGNHRNHHHGNHSHNSTWFISKFNNRTHHHKKYTLHLQLTLQQQSLVPIQLEKCEDGQKCFCKYQRYEVYVPGERFELKSKYINIEGIVGRFWNVTTNGTKHWFHAGLGYYQSNVGDYRSGQPSGAYIFRPDNSTHMHPVPLGDVAAAYIVNTRVVSEIVYQFIDDKLGLTSYLTTRLDSQSEAIEFDNYLNSVNIEDKIGKEVILSLRTNIQNNGTFYTDSNGHFALRRQLNQSESFVKNLSEPIAGNYYPVNGYIGIRDRNTNQTMSLLVDRSQGGTSLHEGQIQIMINRRILKDDWRGVGEALNETEFGRGLMVRTNSWLTFKGIEHVKDFQKNQVEENFQLLFTKDIIQGKIITLYPEQIDKYLKIYLKPLSSQEFIIRLYNYHLRYEKITFNFQNFVKNLLNKDIVEIEMLGLSENMSFKEARDRIQWKIEPRDFSSIKNEDALEVNDYNDILKEGIQIRPQDIMTFKVKV